MRLLHDNNCTVQYNETYSIIKINYHVNMPVCVISDNKK